MPEPRAPQELQQRRSASRAESRLRRRRQVAIAGVLLLGAILAAVLLGSGGGSAKKHSDLGSTTAAKPVRRTVTRLRFTKQAALPGPLQDPAAAALPDGRLALLGGLDVQQRSTARITVGGRRQGSLPAVQHDAQAALLGGRVYVFGGGDQASFDHIQQWDPATGRVSQAGKLPRAASDVGVASIGSTAYVVGGYDGHAPSADILAFSPGSAPKRVGHLPQALRYAAVAAVGGRLVIAGGSTASGGASSDVLRFDPATGAVQRIGRLPQPITHAAAATLGGQVYLIGGRGPATGSVTAAIRSIDPASGSVRSVGSLPRGLSDEAAATSGSRILLAGGHDRRGAVADTGYLELQTRTITSAPAAGAAASGARPTSTTAAAALPGDILIADRGNNRLLLLNNQKQLQWQFPTSQDLQAGKHLKFNDDAFVAPGGKDIVANEEESHVIVSVNIAQHTLTTLYGHKNKRGAGPGFLNTPDDAYPLQDGSVVVADAYNCRILFIKAHKIVRQYGHAGNCSHHPPRTFGAVNGDTPTPDGGLLVSEIPGAWVDRLDARGKLLASFHPAGVSYPSDPQALSGGRILLADYANPGSVLITSAAGKVLWRYKPTGGSGRLDHPSLALMLPNGNIAVNDDFRHRVVIIDPRKKRIVWQFGHTDHKSARSGFLNTPDGMDFVPQGPGGLPNWAAVKHG